MRYREKTKPELLDIIASLEAALDKNADVEARHLSVEDRLKESERRYHDLIDNIPLGMYRRTVGPSGKLIMVNPALVSMFQYDSADELNEVPITRLYYDPADVEEFSRKLFTHREVIREVLKLKTRSGRPIWVAVTARVICDNVGNPLFFDGIMEDITERRRRDEEEKLRVQQLVQADKMISLGVLVSGVAHEINNPNQFIAAHLGPLKRVWDDALPILDRYFDANGDFVLGGAPYSRRRDRVAEMLQGIRVGADRIKHIVDELRDYAKDSPMDLSGPVHINDVIRSAMALLKPLIKESASEFYVTYGNDLPPFKGDYRRIEQVIINLVQNACQALGGDRGKISIKTFADETAEAVIAQIDDTGCGISKDDLARITAPFFTTKRDVGGTGLGLSICETIVSAHVGTMVFSSEEGVGTTVKLTLPAYR